MLNISTFESVVGSACSYDEKRKQFESGHMSDKEWAEYCYNLLSDTLDNNKDILIRLKTR